MPLTMNDLTVNFSHLDQARILDDWRWLIGPNRLPILISAAGDGQVYSLKKPVGLGGEYTLDNIEACDIEVHFSTTGQLGEKIGQSPPGTRIGEVSTS